MKTSVVLRCCLYASFTIIAGCGGSSKIPTKTTLQLTGGAKTLTIASPYEVKASSSPQQFYVTLPGDTEPTWYWVPAGISVAAGEPLVVFPAGTVYFEGMTGGAPASAMEVDRTKPSRGITSGPGTVLINGQPSGVAISNGVLTGTIGFPCTCGQPLYKEEDFGPFTITDSRGKTLTIGKLTWNYDTNGIHTSLPRHAEGDIPGNGSSAKGDALSMTFWPEFSNGVVQLTLKMSTGTFTEFASVTSAGATFRDYFADIQIPPEGITELEFTSRNVSTKSVQKVAVN